MFKISQILKSLAKKYLNIVIILLLFSMSCWANPRTLTSTESEDLISINFYQTDIAIILQALADNKQMNLVMVDDLSTKQTIKLRNVTWQKALTVVLNSANLCSEIDDNILFISKAVDQEVLLQKKLLEQKELQLNQPLALLTIPVNHADLNNLVETIQSQGLLSERGKAFIDKRTNSIIITDMSTKFSNIKKLVKSLDQPIPQVHISAHIVTMNKQSMDELGIKWGYKGHSSQLLSKFDVDFGVTNAPSSVGFNLAKLSGSLLNLELSALESENQLEIIASPNLLTANQNIASIKQGTEIPYEVSNGGNGSTSIEFKQAVLGLEVTPKIIANDQMILDLYITQNTAGRSIKRRDGGEALAIDTQEIRTQVKIKSGETVVLGGIFQQVNNVSKNSVPGISNIPIIGNAFKNKAKKQQKRELVIFITPQLVE
ncbi:type IV pilus secretin PilQ [Gilliamella sp. B14384H2]|uniref:secretin N-terminal domain-containing protein n=1 Tax=unclassified Gilliamella TaxID=2685620 RepID=UPI0018DBAC7C|nr:MULTISPECIES: secretin N-terminal domain-containing protein [unclassified Gilliamella]MBI0037049.1 type IV pilus secretin PilQ [Gilliamella sp. B14384G10]MBI0039297.1 type IV pilus secretin PilQ [Gilliamella sp. B14384G7]MBI0051044.1 type IV pilus secretin PilQ [Gilliamella sp. B14384G13]MBI0053336.1 type IV pilus secretin PilQ [Gilliamella sp. B14384H2]